MTIALCNEVLRDHPFDEQCRLAAALGYDALEVAPFTLSDDPVRLSAQARRDARAMAEDAGIAISGLHWLMNAPEGLSITDPARAQVAADHAKGIVELCADLGGKVLIHGSPPARNLADAPDAETGRATAAAYFAVAGAAAHAHGLTYCLEPLAPELTAYLNTVAECVAVLEALDQPGLATMLDTCAAAGGEDAPAHEVLEQWLPTGRIAHIHLNDPDKRAPGQGDMEFAPVLEVLRRHGYAGAIGIEPFRYEPSGLACAAVAAGYLRGVRESLDVS